MRFKAEGTSRPLYSNILSNGPSDRFLKWAFSEADKEDAPHFTDLPPSPRGEHFVRHIGGHGTRRWLMHLRVKGDGPIM